MSNAQPMHEHKSNRSMHTLGSLHLHEVEHEFKLHVASMLKQTASLQKLGRTPQKNANILN